MSFAPRPTGLPSHIRSSSTLGGGTSQSSALQARINEKKIELENLKQLRDLSAGLAEQMQQLEDKLSTLSNGTEAVAAVMANIPAAKDTEDVEERASLPQTLVRIPIAQAETVQARKTAEKGAEGGD